MKSLAEIELTFSDLVQLVQAKFDNEREHLGYARAAAIVDKAILPHITSGQREVWKEIEALYNHAAFNKKNTTGKEIKIEFAEAVLKASPVKDLEKE